ncbi:hypothetical protein OG909_12210 [Streptomyces sp. NBC_01754]|uniref:hypothetical protein n=1 Tax=Streptomyces sp. NBC_01754 TaxID=2975930 RepID=UPI002DD9AA2F|nr:hypothetical protein [Streptomyces sp. NBC_01754]WSC92998.1 hypothetical protein OG909_12210 [Streptomyces sp. NBC_01754]
MQAISARYEVRAANGQKYGPSFTDLQTALDYCRQTNVNNDETNHNTVIPCFTPVPVGAEQEN